MGVDRRTTLPASSTSDKRRFVVHVERLEVLADRGRCRRNSCRMSFQSFDFAGALQALCESSDDTFMSVVHDLGDNVPPFGASSHGLDPPDSTHFRRDALSQALYPEDAPPDLAPVATYGDWNCLFRAVLKLVQGDESAHFELRLRTVLELALHVEFYETHRIFF